METQKFKKGDYVKCSDGSCGIIVSCDWLDSLNCYQYYIDYIGTLDAGYQLEKDLQPHTITTMNGRDNFEGAKWKHEFECPNGYIFKDENGNVINATKIVLEKKNEYPKFKVGDRIKRKGDIRLTTIKDIKDNYYIITIPDFFNNAYITDKLLFSNQNEYELFPNKFDITNLRPFDKVLVRGDVGQKWTLDFFGFMDKDKGYPFVCVGHYIIQCIPYEGNECLLGTTNDCDDFYKTWK